MPVDNSIDLELLLAPLTTDNPAGIDLKAARAKDESPSLLDTIQNLRRTDDPLGMTGFRPVEVRSAEWPKIVEACSDALATRSKDLQIAVWLTEALLKTQGLSGLIFGLQLVRGLLERFWSAMYPVLGDEDNLYIRAGLLYQMDSLIAGGLPEAKLTETKLPNGDEGPAFSFLEWLACQTATQNAMRTKDAIERPGAIKACENRRDELDKAIKGTSREFYERLDSQLDTCVGECTQLEMVIEAAFKEETRGAKMDDLPPKLSATKERLREFRGLVQRILSGKPVEVRKTQSSELPTDGATPKADLAISIEGLEPADRFDALQRLTAIAHFFQRTEPHSPVSYLVQRAARWGEMSLDSWLDEVVGDPTVLTKIRQTLGLQERGKT